MKAFILTDGAATVYRAVEVPNASYIPPADPDQFWVEVPVPVSRHSVALIDGEVVPVQNERSPAVQLEVAKAVKRRQLNAMRDTLEFGWFTWDGSIFDANEKSQARIQGAFQLASLALATSQAFSVDWTLADNTVRTLSATDWMGVGQALAAHIQTCHVTARSLKAQVDAATSIEEVEAIQWPQ